MVRDILKNTIKETISDLSLEADDIHLEHPSDFAYGDYSTNVAMRIAKQIGENPKELAREITDKIREIKIKEIEKVKVAGAGFINFYLSREFFTQSIKEILKIGEKWGSGNSLKNQKIIIEYTDPNPFKEFHIGHLMSNTIGESISRIIEASGADTKRACYQGDVGLHVAKAIRWVLEEENMAEKIRDAVGGEPAETLHDWEYLLQTGKAYARGSSAYEKSYVEGRKLSLEYFETIYKRLGSNHGDGKAFNFYFFESETGVFGKEVVEKYPDIFEKSDGAIVYRGDEAKGLHTRVFINKEGLPTYEAKELGLAKIKYDAFPYDVSIVVTGNEVNDYFRVLLDAMSKVFPELAAKTEHYSHGMLRLPTGKMSSRTGDVITAESLIEEARDRITKRVEGV